MRYFTYMADQAFKTGPNGERLFIPYGPLSRPYIVPDSATEARLYKKLLWEIRIKLGLVTSSIWILTVFFPQYLNGTFLIFLPLMLAVSFLSTNLALASELKGLPRSGTRLPISTYCRQIAEKHSTTALALGFTCSLAFVALSVSLVAISVSLVASGLSMAIGIIGMAFFGLMSVSWGYTLLLKRRTQQVC